MSSAKSPRKQGLYDPAFERDACGVGFVADIKNRPSRMVIESGIRVLANLEHRGAVGANPTTGDGAGILLQIPDSLFREECAREKFDLPSSGEYGVGFFFLPQNSDTRKQAKALIESVLAEAELPILGWRKVPTDSGGINDEVRASEPSSWQVFAGRGEIEIGDDFERKLFVVRKQIEHRAKGLFKGDAAGFYCASFSSRTVVYKGMFLAGQLSPYYPDLSDARAVSALALIHQRFSTNTFPAWSLAHPYRMIAHNGEINTLRGNLNNMLARHRCLSSPLFGDDLEKIWPLIDEGQSDTACFDNALELLRLAGYSLAQAAAILIPEAWQGNPLMNSKRRAFYQHHATMMEPWDGPAAVAFTDGVQIGATLDRNGLRPARYFVTDDDLIVMASEAGVLPTVDDSKIRRKWRLEPGKMLLVDLSRGEIVDDAEVKRALAESRPYKQWVEGAQIKLKSLPTTCEANGGGNGKDDLLRRQQAFGYTEEDIKFILRPMVENAEEPVGSMGDDAPQAVLSLRMKPLFNYFRQEFAQVTNPPIDPIREEMVMSLGGYLGERPNLLAVNRPTDAAQLAIANPILTPSEMSALRNASECCEGRLEPRTLDITFPAEKGGGGMEAAMESLCESALKSIRNGVNILILSDRGISPARAAIPILLAVSAVHHHLIEEGERTRAGLVAETGAAREVHHFAALAGYGAEAIFPYLAYRVIKSMELFNEPEMPPLERIARYRKAVCKGIYKVMSKMGVSTFQSYCGAQIFEAVGLRRDFVDKYFRRTVSQIEGAGLAEIAEESLFWHRVAFDGKPRPLYQNALDAGGDYAFRARGEEHLWTPQSIAKLQHAVRGKNADSYREYADLINNQSRRLMTLRGLLQIREGGGGVPLEEVESAAEMVKRFSTGAMSFGSLSREAHATLAIAMNRIGGKSNTGEGGEESERYRPLAGGDSMRSAIKQVASGRFGVTAEYLINSDMMQIKIAQGAKPGEGGQLPGHKVDREIARVRHSVPGVGLISPPPHHDIYSIEDIAQLIYDLKNINPRGQVSVKLVSRCGVGTVAAGVAKAKADHITIAGHDGGTGASPISSIKRAGTPWELGLSETHQTLVINGLRGRVALQVDGQIKTGRDVVVGALLGADEFGFATAPLVAEGCIMMRKCHLNTCPVGIATQRPELRRKFAGQPEHVINYFFFVAEEARALMAQMGFRYFDEMIGRVDMLNAKTADFHWKARGINLSPILHSPSAPSQIARHHCEEQNHHLDRAMDNELIACAKPALDGGEKIEMDFDIRNLNRTVGAMLSGEVASRFGHQGLPDDTIRFRFNGVAGQSFGAFLARGITLELRGEANDYAGKGLSGGILAIYPPESSREDGVNIIVGNTVLYGAIAGECYFRGVAGERFAVRNSGASAVVEGAGDHCCEYMTGGTVIVLGEAGRNFAAGMSGGIAYVLDESGGFEKHCNAATVSLSPLEESVSPGQHLRRSDSDIVRDFLHRHINRTGSPKARAILNNWETMKPRFVKVTPREYRRALIELEKADAEKAA